MNGFIVMQGETYLEEKKRGILWSPQKDKSGLVPPSYKRMREVKKGDRIFHYVRGSIVAVSVAGADCTESGKPQNFKSSHSAASPGYLVQADYHELDDPLSVSGHIEQLRPHLPVKYSAFQKDGSGNPGYLYPCNDELMIKLLEAISRMMIHTTGQEQLELAIEVVRRTEHNPLTNLIAETELAAKLKMRRGKERHREKMLPLWSHQCVLCGIAVDALLEAAPSKPWKDSSDQERIDPFNGVLLCRNHASLYKNGLIAFNGPGKLHISGEIDEEQSGLIGLGKTSRIPVQQENKPFLKWHKKHVFIDEKD